MNAGGYRKLRFYRFWLIIGYMMIAFVAFETLTPLPLDFGFWIEVEAKDKVLHIIAYFGLMTWFVLLYEDRVRLLLIAALFMLLGIVLEFLQYYGAARYFSYADMVANAVGVLLGLLLAITPLKDSLLWIERRWLLRASRD